MIYTIGDHKVKHGNLMESMADLMGNKKASVFNADPPWGQGNLNYWQTINTRQTGAEKIELNHSEFLDRVLDLAIKYTDGPVIIVYGLRWKEELIRRATGRGLQYFTTADSKYRSGSKFLPLNIHVFGTRMVTVPADYAASLKDAYGYDAVYKSILPFAEPGKIILDPSCGLGLTARVAIKTGMTFYGNEINIKRVEETVRKLKQ